MFCASKLGVSCARGCVARPERVQGAQSLVVVGGFSFWKSLKLMWGWGGLGVLVCGEVWVDGPSLARCGVMTSMSELLDGLLARHPTVHRNAVPWAVVTRKVRTPSEFLDWFGVPDSQSGA